ncbi:MAG: dihydrofolate reductase [Bacteroidota bacterium]
MISIVVAADINNVIGNENKLIWHLPADLAYFKKVTMGKTIVMGRKTFESIGRPLPGRKNVIITRNQSYSPEGVFVYHNPDEVIAEYSNQELMIIGGAEIYNLFLPITEKIYLTRVHHSFEGDTIFPSLNNSEWKIISEEFHLRDEKNHYDYTFMLYERIR